MKTKEYKMRTVRAMLLSELHKSIRKKCQEIQEKLDSYKEEQMVLVESKNNYSLT